MGTVSASPAAAASNRWTWSRTVAMLGKRKPVQDPPLRATDMWSHALSSLRRRSNIVLGDDGQRSKRVIQRFHTLYLSSVRLAHNGLDQASALYATFSQHASPLQFAIGLSIASLMLLIILFILTRTAPISRRIPKVRNNLKEGPSAEEELDSDEFEFEEDSTEEGTASSENGMARKLRRALLPSRTHRRSSSKEGGSTARRPNSIIRITSSDPRSQLSINALQMDLDSSGEHLFRSGSNLGSNVRRRKESGRLLAGMAQDSAATASAASSIPAPSARIIHTAARMAKQRRPSPRAAELERRLSRPDGPSRLRQSAASGDDDEFSQTPSSPNSITSFSSALTGADDPEWHPIESATSPSLTSILRREPQKYAGLPELPLQMDDIASQESDYNFTSSWSNGAPTSGSSEQQSVRSLPSTPTPSSRLPPGAGYAPDSPLGRSSPVPRLGTLSPEQSQALWPEKRARMVKLKEPDWRPYADLHERARERMEKFAELTGRTGLARSASPMLMASGSSVSEEDSRNGTPTGEEGEEDFWYERFTRSTAASGRDWDWRKRRARQAAALRASAALDIIGGSDNGVVTSSGSASPAPQVPPKLAADESYNRNSASALNTVTSTSTASSSTSTAMQRNNPPVAPLRSTSQQPKLGLSQRLLPPNQLGFDSGVSPKSMVFGDDVHGLPSDEANSPTAAPSGLPNGPRSTVQPSASGNESSIAFLPALPPVKRNRRYSDTDQSDADAATNVPGRLSSLKPKGVKKIMTSRRERSSALSAALTSIPALPEEEDNGLEMTTTTSVNRDEHDSRSPRRSSSVTQLDRAYARGATDLTSVRRPSPLASTPHGWSVEHVYSSADAYGSPTDFQQEREAVTRNNILLSSVPLDQNMTYDDRSRTPEITGSPQRSKPPQVPRRRDTEPRLAPRSATQNDESVNGGQGLTIPGQSAQMQTGKHSPSRRDILLSAAQRSI